VQLVVQKDTVLSKIPDEILDKKQKDRDAHFLTVAGFDLSVGDGRSGDGAAAGNFEMIPDFESFSSGLHLGRDWRNRGISSWLGFNGGAVVAVPDEYSVEQTCRWTSFEPAQPNGPQRLTSNTAYVGSVQTSSSLVLTSRDDPGKQFSIDLKAGRIFAAFANVAVDGDPGSYRADFDHINAMFRLCDKKGEVRFTLGEMQEDRLLLRRQDWPEWLQRLLARNQYLVGRPHCGARQMRAPL
jgi:hypothetical protein